MTEKLVYSTMENLADQLGYKRNCLQQRLRTMGWTSEDLKDPLKMSVFVEANKSPYLAVAKCMSAVILLREKSQKLEQDNVELKSQHDALKIEFSDYKAKSEREIRELRTGMKALELKVNPALSIDELAATLPPAKPRGF